MTETRLTRSLEWMNRHPIISILLGAIIAIGVIPWVVNLTLLLPISSNGTNSDWIGFWGSYLGGLFTLIALISTIAWERKRAKMDKQIIEDQIRLEGENKRIELDLNMYKEYSTILDVAIEYFKDFIVSNEVSVKVLVDSIKEEFLPVRSMARRVKSQQMQEAMHGCVAVYAPIDRFPEVSLTHDNILSCSSLVHEKLSIARSTLDILTPITTLGFPPRFVNAKREKLVRQYLGLEE